MRSVKKPVGYVYVDGCWNCIYSLWLASRDNPKMICDSGEGARPDVDAYGKCPKWKKPDGRKRPRVM